MKRLTRWCWAAGCSLLVFYVSCATLALLFFGAPFSYEAAPLGVVAEWMFEVLKRLLGSEGGVLCGFILTGTPAALATALMFTRLRKRREGSDGHLHCLKCGYILKGLSEPRCPECGERI